MNESWKETIVTISRPVRIAVVCALATLALFLLTKTWQTFREVGDMYAPGSITVTGTGKASAAPNIAHLSFTVQETAVTVTEAQDVATKKTNAALEAVKGAGVDEKDITTTGYNVYPQYSNPSPCFGGICPMQENPPKIVGYQVSQSVEIKVREIEKAGDILQKLGSLNVQNISGPNFMVDDDSLVTTEARGKAIEDAQEKAELLAKQLGVSLGDITSFCEDNCVDFSMPEFGKAAGMDMVRSMSAVAPAPSLPAGEQMTVKTVQITYEIR